jgi:hypothetical protein
VSANAASTVSRIPREFITQRQGKDHVSYAGLLDLAHRDLALSGIRTQLIQAPSPENGHTAIMWAEVTTNRGVFTGIGDANPDNVGRMIVPHAIRMAETRAKARALRDAANIGGAALEELGDERDDEPRQPAPQRPAPKAPIAFPAQQAANASHHALLLALGTDRHNSGEATITIPDPLSVAQAQALLDDCIAAVCRRLDAGHEAEMSAPAPNGKLAAMQRRYGEAGVHFTLPARLSPPAAKHLHQLLAESYVNDVEARA